MNTEVMFSSERKDWETPPEIFDPLNDEFGFTLDVCADWGNYKVANFLLGPCHKPKFCMCGLCLSWEDEVCWMNPPYGREIVDWVRKASTEFPAAVVVALLPARTDTQWWHQYVKKTATEIRFLEGRVKFVGAENSAPFPSVIVVWNGIDPTKDLLIF